MNDGGGGIGKRVGYGMCGGGILGLKSCGIWVGHVIDSVLMFDVISTCFISETYVDNLVISVVFFLSTLPIGTV